MEKRFYGQYRGLVIQNDDPEKRGRIKVFVPQVNLTLYDDWNALASDDANGTDPKFTFLGRNVNSDLMPVLMRLKEKLPWSEVAQPIIGASSSGMYNAPLERASIAHSSEEMTGVKDQCLTPEAMQSQQQANQQKSKNNSGAGPTDFPPEPAKPTSEETLIPQGSNADTPPDIASVGQQGEGGVFVPKYPTTANGESSIFSTSSDPAGVGGISSGMGDFGGKSYGTYQFASNSDASDELQGFLNSPKNPYGNELKASGSIGSEGFDNKWKELAQSDNREFGLAQEQYFEQASWAPKTKRFEQLSGVDLSTKSDTLNDVVVGSVNQYGGLTDGMAKYIKQSGGQSLTSNQIGLLLQDYKAANIENHFQSSDSRVKGGVSARIGRERALFEGEDNEIGETTNPLAVSEADTPPTETIKSLDQPRTGGTASSAGEQKPSPQAPVPPKTLTDACGSTMGEAYNKAPAHDNFDKAGTADANNNKANPFTHLFRTPSYTNKASGSFSIPAVGSHVWVFFEQGDPQYPIIWSVIFGKEDINGIYETHDDDGEKVSKVEDASASELAQGNSPDYPSDFENRPPESGEGSEEDQVFRSKWVINQRGGSIEIVSTYERERVRFAHHNGSMIDMNKLCMSRLCTENDQLLVKKDQFETIKGFKSLFVDKDFDQIVYGDVYLKQGDWRKWKPHSDKIKGLLRPIHDKKRLFDLMRVDKTDNEDHSPLQSKSGGEVACPVCAQGKQFVQVVTEVSDELVDGAPLVCGGGTTCYGKNSRTVDRGVDVVEPLAGKGGTMYEDPCWSCGDSGLSPSSQDGAWAQDGIKEEIEQDIEAMTHDLAEHEKQLGQVKHREGGNLFELTAKNRTVLIGQTFNDFESYRRDEAGKLVPYGYKIDKGGVYPEYIKSPLVEKVHVDPLPGGDYDITACQRFGLNVGSGGCRIRTTGGLELFATLINIGGESVQMSSRSDISFDASSRFDVEADVITLRPREVTRDGKVTQQVGIFGNLNVGKNIVTRGGIHCEGEFSFQHMSAPLEWHQTNVEPEITLGSMLPGKLIGKVTVIGGGSYSGGIFDVISVCAPDCIEVNPHVHWFMGPPMTLYKTHDEVRETGARCNDVSVVVAHPVDSVKSNDAEILPEGSEIGYAVCEDPKRWLPGEGPNGEDELMEPDPELEGFGDGTVESNTDTTEERTKQIDAQVNKLRKQARDKEAKIARRSTSN